jgi:hypothetical protein
LEITRNENSMSCTKINTIITNTSINNLVNNVSIPNKEIDENNILVNRLDEIFHKYKNTFDVDDATDLKTIIDTLNANLEFS